MNAGLSRAVVRDVLGLFGPVLVVGSGGWRRDPR